MGRLLSKEASGITRHYLYSGDALVAEYEGTTLKKRYIHGPGIDNPMVEYNGSSVSQANRRFYHSNHQGSIIAMTDYGGAAIEINTYDSFGVPVFGAQMGSNDVRFAYTGQLYIPELEMYHYKARVYDPKLGRFLKTDPIGYDDQMNLYAYVGNDPMTKNDPTGLFDQCGISCNWGQGWTDNEWGAYRESRDFFTANIMGNIFSVMGEHQGNPTARNFERFLTGGGDDLEISQDEFLQLLKVGQYIPGNDRIPVLLGNGSHGSKRILSFYDTQFGYAFGNATVFYDSDGFPVGFYDLNDYNPANHRTSEAEFATYVGNIMNTLGLGTPFITRFGTTGCKKCGP